MSRPNKGALDPGMIGAALSRLRGRLLRGLLGGTTQHLRMMTRREPAKGEPRSRWAMAISTLPCSPFAVSPH